MELSYEQIEAKRHNSFSDAIKQIKKETKKWKYIIQSETGSNEELNSFVLELLRSVRSIGDDDFYNSVKDEITNISSQIDDALNNLNVMERKLNEMKGQSNHKDLEN